MRDPSPAALAREVMAPVALAREATARAAPA